MQIFYANGLYGNPSVYIDPIGDVLSKGHHRARSYRNMYDNSQY